MNILITGIHGFVGSNLVAALKTKHTIYGLDIVSPAKGGVEKTFTWNELDTLPAIDVVIHLAGKAHDTKNQTNAQVYFDINTELTQKIYDWFVESEAKKFIFFSSVKAAADRVETDILTEDIVPTPKGPYGESKIAAEKYILSHSSGHNTQNYYILRPCMIHGPGNKGNLNLLYNVVKKGIPYPLGAFENRRSFTSIDNLSFVIGKLIQTDISSGIYNVADDENLSTNELIALISKVLNKSDRIWNWNASVIRFCAQVGTKFHLPLNNERLQKLTENYVVSNAKLKKALGIEKMPVSSKEGFTKTIKSFENL
ncbi:MAG TPA: NAD-dependent epimerase/dehydratase family protein [Paludibacter sp.]|nr:NAD-dependent epimerase/dehydratase family protein [Paludibacter sp.]